MKKILIAILKYTFLVLLLGGLGFGIVWSNLQAREEVCAGVEIDIVKNDSVEFITRRVVAEELASVGIKIKGEQLRNINTEEIENILKEYDYVENAEVGILNNNKVRIEVQQLVPIMRVYNRYGDSYYVNAIGKKMKTEPKYSMDVPVITGNFKEIGPTAMAMIPMVKYITERPELARYVTLLDVKNLKNVYIYPNIRGHVVNFGSPDDFDNKFAKLKQMYDEVIPVKGWWMYDTISVKWRHQIVASRRNKRLPKEVQYIPEEDEIAPDVSTMSVKPLDAATVQADINRAEAAGKKHEQQEQSAPVQSAEPVKEIVQPAPQQPENINEKPAAGEPKHKKPGDVWKN